jgi:Zn-dependent peptidase ImmA (M78 family)
MTGKRDFTGSFHDIEELGKTLRSLTFPEGARGLAVRKALEETVEALGGTIDVTDDPDELERDSGSLVIKNENEFTIWLSPYTSPLRDNFTIAHETGHLFLHYDSKSHRDQPVIFRRSGNDRQEIQANRFAAALLTPADQFERKYEEFGGNYSFLSGFFGVSKSVVRVRAESLSLG